MEVNNYTVENKEWLEGKDREDLRKALEEALEIESPVNPPISAMGSVNIEEINTMINNWNRVPTPDELMEANNRLNRVLVRYIKTLRELIYIPSMKDEDFDVFTALRILSRILEEEKVVLKDENEVNRYN